MDARYRWSKMGIINVLLGLMTWIPDSADNSSRAVASLRIDNDTITITTKVIQRGIWLSCSDILD